MPPFLEVTILLKSQIQRIQQMVGSPGSLFWIDAQTGIKQSINRKFWKDLSSHIFYQNGLIV
jgi:hypothetical protein